MQLLTTRKVVWFVISVDSLSVYWSVCMSVCQVTFESLMHMNIIESWR